MSIFTQILNINQLFNNNNNSINNNEHKLVNISHLLLKKIISYLDSNLDRICLSLVCKRWYDERDGYLYFNNSKLVLNSNLKHTIKSYQKQFESSISQKRNAILFISDTLENKKYTSYDYGFTNKDNIIIADTVTDLIIDFFDSSHLLGVIKKRLAASNVKNVKFCYVDPKFAIGKLPNNIVKIEIVGNFNLQFEIGQLPSQLEVLSLSGEYRHTFNQKVLPATLRVLKLGSYTKPFNVGQLPSHLEKLHFHTRFTCGFISGSLPLSLVSLVNISELPLEISKLVLLKKLKISTANDLKQLKAAHIPLSVEKLSIETDHHFSVKLMKEFFDFKHLNQRLQPRQQNSVRKLTISILGGLPADVVGAVPYGVESLDLGANCDELTVGCIPQSVKELTLSRSMKELAAGVIPDSVVTLNTETYRYSMQSPVIPPSVRNLNVFFRLWDTIQTIPKTVKTITVRDHRSIYSFRRLDDVCKSSDGDNPNENYLFLYSTKDGFSNLTGGFIKPKSIDSFFNKWDDF